MGALTTKCTNCSTPNEVDTDLLPVGAASIHCYHCAAAIAITQIQIAEARKNPSVQEIGRGSAGRTLLSDRDRPGGPLLSPVTIVLALGVVLVFALVVTVGFVAYSRFGGGNVEGATGQARCGFHRGTGVPSGTKAWQADIVARSGFAPARSGDLIIVAGNEPRAGDAATYAPRGIDEELLDSLRALHSKMLRNGYEPMTPPEQTALQNEQAQRFQTRFEKGTCYTIAVIGGSKATDVDLLLYHSDGVRLIIADTRGDRDAHLEHCPVKSEAYEFEVRMHRGFGLVTHAIYRQTDRPFHDRGHLYALKLSDGEVAWEHPLGEQVSSSPASDEQFVAIGTRSKTRSQATRDVLEAGSVTVYNATDGSPQCSFEAAGPVLSTPTIRQGIAYFGSCGIPSSRAKNRTICDPDAPVKSQVYALRLESCDVLWSHTTTHAVIAPVAVDSERVYLTAGGKILALDLELGTLSWSSETQGHAPAPVAADGMVVYGSADGSVRRPTDR